MCSVEANSWKFAFPDPLLVSSLSSAQIKCLTELAETTRSQELAAW